MANELGNFFITFLIIKISDLKHLINFLKSIFCVCANRFALINFHVYVKYDVIGFYNEQFLDWSLRYPEHLKWETVNCTVIIINIATTSAGVPNIGAMGYCTF